MHFDSLPLSIRRRSLTQDTVTVARSVVPPSGHPVPVATVESGARQKAVTSVQDQANTKRHRLRRIRSSMSRNIVITSRVTSTTATAAYRGPEAEAGKEKGRILYEEIRPYVPPSVSCQTVFLFLSINNVKFDTVVARKRSSPGPVLVGRS